MPVQWHALCFGLFASIIAPFGGFFASGFKRAFNIKVTNHFQYLVKHYFFYEIAVVNILILNFRILVIVFLDMAVLLIEWIAR